MNEEIEKNLKELVTQLQKSNSYKLVLLRGVVQGFGTAVGATFLVGIAVSILSMFTDFFPWLNTIT